ncbi:MAG: hypothetical protein J4F41_07385 [Alphaproteobacteria bacterium]|nr:hypothetical protein [Alphaproteobacteria bacterium]
MLKRLVCATVLIASPAAAGVSSVDCFVDGTGSSKAGVTVTFDDTPTNTSSIALQFKTSSSDASPVSLSGSGSYNSSTDVYTLNLDNSTYNSLVAKGYDNPPKLSVTADNSTTLHNCS